MTDIKPIFHLHVFGRIDESSSSSKLLIFANFMNSRAVSWITIEQSQLIQVQKSVLELRSFIEGQFPPLSSVSLKEIGTNLFNLVLQGDVRALFERASGWRKDILPFEILVEDLKVAAWPWEYMYDVTNHKFICREFFPISRGIFCLESKIEFLKSYDKIQILVAICVPVDDELITPQEEIRAISNVFDQYIIQDQVSVDVIVCSGPEVLMKELQKQRYDVLHFYGHAGFDDSSKQGYVIFERTKGKSRYSAEQFGRLLANRGIRLVFLNACETGRVDSEIGNFGATSVASALLERGIPAIIATQFSMPDNGAHSFASSVYNALAYGKCVAEAVKDGREAMHFGDDSAFYDWGIPVLYSFDPNLIIFSNHKQAITNK